MLLGRCLQLSGGGLPFARLSMLGELTGSLDRDQVDALFDPARADLRRLLPGATPTRSTEPASALALVPAVRVDPTAS